MQLKRNILNANRNSGALTGHDVTNYNTGVGRRALVRRTVMASLSALSLFVFAPAGWATSSTTTLSVSPSTSVPQGTVITLNASVSSGGSIVNPGQVVFCNASAPHCEDSAIYGKAQLNSSGQASISLRLPLGPHAIKAVFSGKNTAAKSTSSVVNVTVTGLNAMGMNFSATGVAGNYKLSSTLFTTGAIPTGSLTFLDATNGSYLLGSAPLTGGAKSLSFTAKGLAESGVQANLAPSADFNGDGIPDLAYGDSATSSLSVLLGNGDGTFTNYFSGPVGTGPYSVAIADFNGDGIPDMAVTNAGDNTVTILLGQFDGSFSTKSLITVGTNPRRIVAGDFNGDGSPDLAITNVNDNTVTILLGNWDGTFNQATGSPMSVGAFPYGLAVGDFNGDGILDIAEGNANDSTILVFLGNGDGTFTFKFDCPTGAGSGNVVSADFNGDGITDLAGTDSYDNTVSVYLGNGDGTFKPRTTTSVGTSTSISALVAADFDGDGKMDLLTGGSIATTLKLLTGKGDGTFAPAKTVSGSGNQPTGLAVADFNGDGAPDVATANFGDSTVSILLGKQQSTATASISAVSVPGGGTHHVYAHYAGDGTHRSGNSPQGSVTGSPVTTTTALSISPSLNVNYGQTVQLTANVSPFKLGTYNATGTVTFRDGTTTIGTASVSSGQAVMTTNTLNVGTHHISALYGGDVNFTTSTSSASTLTVTAATPAATPTFTLAPGTYTGTQKVGLKETTPGATMYYTTDGTTPTTASTRYTGSITVSSSETIKAIATSANYLTSAVATGSYIIQ